jgi:hypothetical protein
MRESKPRLMALSKQSNYDNAKYARARYAKVARMIKKEAGLQELG